MTDTVAVGALPRAEGPYSIKRHGVTITNCDAEPVQTPGCIQDHGALLVLRPGDLTIVQASENSERWLGQAVVALLGKPVSHVLGEEGQRRVRDCVRDEPIERNPLYLFTLPARGAVPPPWTSRLMELVVSRAERLAELNADLSRSNEELDAFAYVASHDLKEPLRGIHKYAHQLLEDATVLNDEHRRKLEALLRLTIRMDALLDSLLHFSRVGRTALELEATDLDEVVKEAVEMVAGRTTAATVDLRQPRPLPATICDRVRIREVYVNLIANALKYNDHPRKRVEVGHIPPGEDAARPNCPPGAEAHTIYYVRDDGIGIAERHCEQVFLMFRRLHGRDDYGGGSGAGLTIVKKLVERHRGQVWLDSVVGLGTTVYFTLPAGETVTA